MLTGFNPSLHWRRRLLNLLGLSALPVAILYTAYAVDTRPSAADKPTPPPAPTVSVVSVSPNTHQVQLQGHGEARPRYALTLKAEVSGRIIELNPAFETGQRLAANAILANIDSVSYDHQVAVAQQSLADAEVAWLQEQQEASRAAQEWQQANLEKESASPLLLRTPQLKAVRARLLQAQAQLTQAQRDLANSQLKAPFDALVVERHVVPGQYVQAGDVVATLYSTDRVDIAVKLPRSQWSLLPDSSKLQQSPVTLSDAQGNQWQAKVTRMEQHLDSQSRQRQLVVSVDQPLQQTPPLLAGAFLRVEFSGEQHADLLSVPASSLTANGDIWHVTDNNRLAHFPAHIVFQQQGQLFIKTPSGTQSSQPPLNVLTAPSTSYLNGQKVLTTPEFSQEISAR